MRNKTLACSIYSDQKDTWVKVPETVYCNHVFRDKMSTRQTSEGVKEKEKNSVRVVTLTIMDLIEWHRRNTIIIRLWRRYVYLYSIYTHQRAFFPETQQRCMLYCRRTSYNNVYCSNYSYYYLCYYIRGPVKK